MVVPKGIILDVHYESLVENQEYESRRMLEFVGLEWEDEVLAFYKSNATITTASVAQVKLQLNHCGT